jgi:diaminopimelate decarboxylase/aspartate kinase
MKAEEAQFPDSRSLGAPETIADSPWVVMKFGGTSVSTAENWRTIATLIRNRQAAGLRPVVVHSALRGVSNTLTAMLDSSVQGDSGDFLAAIREQHLTLAANLGIDGEQVLAAAIDELERLVAGVCLVREASPRVRARVLAQGELMATRLGAAWLQQSGIATAWQDAREILRSEDRSDAALAQNYLSATCGYGADPALAKALAAQGKVILTQGFIARNARGDTVLLGREGSDTSAAYLAAKLQARRLEIWTDVPGMYTADPRLVPSARLLLELHYDEAQELASMGSKVLHPRCLSPLRTYSIPLFLRCTSAPQLAGTVVSAVTTTSEPQVKGISTRSGTVLISMEGTAMWHEVGFLADAFSCFKAHGVSVDLVSTSETNVTVSIDTSDDMLTADVREALLRDLELLCRVRVIFDCAVVSLVGRKIRTILPRLAPALTVFEEEKIHLVSQASNDLNFSFVIDQSQVARIVGKLHATMIGQAGGRSVYGPSWEQLFREQPAPAEPRDIWWQRKRNALLDLAAGEQNAYVYDLETVRKAATDLRAMNAVDRVLYAVKANFNTRILQVLAELGVDFDCVSPGEVQHLRRAVPEIDCDRILFTPNFASRSEYEWALEQGLHVTLDNLYPLREWSDIFHRRKLFIRLDPGQGRGHHEHVKTAGAQSKFGIPRFEVDELVQLAQRSEVEIVGIHAHSGSGILDPDNWRAVAGELIKVARRFPSVRVLDLGGGLGVPERSSDRPFDLHALDRSLAEIKAAAPDYELWLEPGRYLVAEAGVLIAHVTQTKGKGDFRYVGISTGMNSLIRPALYGAYHEIVNLSRLGEPATDLVTVVGPICETGDRLGTDRQLPPSQENDVILIGNAGAYGFVMGSQYNLRGVAKEVVLEIDGSVSETS